MNHSRTLILLLVIAALVASLTGGWAWDDLAPLGL